MIDTLIFNLIFLPLFALGSLFEEFGKALDCWSSLLSLEEHPYLGDFGNSVVLNVHKDAFFEILSYGHLYHT